MIVVYGIIVLYWLAVGKVYSQCPIVTYNAPANCLMSGSPAVRMDSAFSTSMDSICAAASVCSVKLYITNSYRYPGQPLSGTVVNPAKNSSHLVGHAIDFNLQYSGSSLCNSKCLASSSPPAPVQCFLKQIRSNSKLRYGGDFSKKDPVHIDDGINVNQPTQYHQLYNQIATNCGTGTKPTPLTTRSTTKPPGGGGGNTKPPGGGGGNTKPPGGGSGNTKPTTSATDDPNSTTDDPNSTTDDPNSTTDDPDSTTDDNNGDSTTTDVDLDSTTDDNNGDSTTTDVDPDSTTDDNNGDSTTTDVDPDSTTDDNNGDSTTADVDPNSSSTDPPVTDPPETDPPVTDPPETDPPETDPPETDPPVTNPPETDPPETDPPVTDPPETDPPEIDPPVTDPPDYGGGDNGGGDNGGGDNGGGDYGGSSDYGARRRKRSARVSLKNDFHDRLSRALRQSQQMRKLRQ